MLGRCRSWAWLLQTGDDGRLQLWLSGSFWLNCRCIFNFWVLYTSVILHSPILARTMIYQKNRFWLNCFFCRLHPYFVSLAQGVLPYIREWLNMTPFIMEIVCSDNTSHLIFVFLSKSFLVEQIKFHRQMADKLEALYRWSFTSWYLS